MGRRGVSEAQWRAARAMSEGAVPTRARVARVLGIDPSHVLSRSAGEGWTVIDGRNMEIRALYREAQAVAAALSGREPPLEQDEDDDAGTLILPDSLADTAGTGIAAGAGGLGGADAAAATQGSAGAASASPSGTSSQGLAVPASQGLAVPASQGLAVPEWDRLDPVELLANAGAFVARQIGRLIQAADRRGGRLDKTQVDGLAALAKMLDRWETLARERAVDDRVKSDGDLAEIFRTIDARIVELAGEAARFMDARKPVRGRGAKRVAGMADAGADGTAAGLADR